jgi:16S rRNA (cytidine1402-2'-O)-methyltransferase
LEGCKVDSIPGANAILPALQLSGFPPDTFYFAGFLPKKDTKFLSTMSEFPPTTILFYESPIRLKNSLQRLSETLGDKPVAVCIELTKKFETVYRGRISEVLHEIGDNSVKGEVTVVLDNR